MFVAGQGRPGRDRLDRLPERHQGCTNRLCDETGLQGLGHEKFQWCGDLFPAPIRIAVVRRVGIQQKNRLGRVRGILSEPNQETLKVRWSKHLFLQIPQSGCSQRRMRFTKRTASVVKRPRTPGIPAATPTPGTGIPRAPLTIKRLPTDFWQKFHLRGVRQTVSPISSRKPARYQTQGMIHRPLRDGWTQNDSNKPVNPPVMRGPGSSEILGEHTSWCYFIE